MRFCQYGIPTAELTSYLQGPASPTVPTTLFQLKLDTARCHPRASPLPLSSSSGGPEFRDSSLRSRMTAKFGSVTKDLGRGLCEGSRADSFVSASNFVSFACRWADVQCTPLQFSLFPILQKLFIHFVDKLFFYFIHNKKREATKPYLCSCAYGSTVP